MPLEEQCLEWAVHLIEWMQVNLWDRGDIWVAALRTFSSEQDRDQQPRWDRQIFPQLTIRDMCCLFPIICSIETTIMHNVSIMSVDKKCLVDLLLLRSFIQIKPRFQYIFTACFKHAHIEHGSSFSISTCNNSNKRGFRIIRFLMRMIRLLACLSGLLQCYKHQLEFNQVWCRCCSYSDLKDSSLVFLAPLLLFKRASSRVKRQNTPFSTLLYLINDRKSLQKCIW